MGGKDTHPPAPSLSVSSTDTLRAQCGPFHLKSPWDVLPEPVKPPFPKMCFSTNTGSSTDGRERPLGRHPWWGHNHYLLLSYLNMLAPEFPWFI